MAPSRVIKRQSNLRFFGKVSKTASNAAAVYVKSTQKTIGKVIDLPLVEIENEEKLRPTIVGKRKRDTDDDGKNGPGEEGAINNLPSTKKSRLTSKVHDSLDDLAEIHKHFLTAFSIHCAHNGTSTPAELGAIQQSVTRLWKKRMVTTEDLQRMLAVYEIEATETVTQREVNHNKAPFKLVILGVGSNACNTVQYAVSTQLDEKQEVHVLWRCHSTPQLNTYHDLPSIPLLSFHPRDPNTTTPTQSHSPSRAHPEQDLPLNVPSQEPDVSCLTITRRTAIPVPTPSALKARTLSLFDRVKAKQTLLASTSTPTVQQVLRKHAIGRIAEVVEILRMRQQQSSAGRNGGRVSFSSKQIMEIIKQSMSVPIGDEEVRACLDMLSRDVPGGW